MTTRIRIALLIFAALSCVPAFGEKVLLGKLGQAIAKTAIYSRPSPRSHVYYHVKANEYLVLAVNKASKLVIVGRDDVPYYRVLLQNMSYGYIPATEVASLPYNVTAQKQQDYSGLYARNYMPLTSRSGAGLARYAQEFTGTPYKWGGNDPERGIDCSGFVKFLYGKIGERLPRTAAEQATVGEPITRLEDLRAGDRLYFWSSKRNKIGHTGIYIGNGLFCHSSMGHNGVATDVLTPKWQAILVAARR